MISKIILFACCICFASVNVVVAQDAFQVPESRCRIHEPKQLIIGLTIFDPWQMVLGSDSPYFALYEDGQVIYWDADEEEHLTITLDKETLDEWLDVLVTDDFFMLDDYYDLAAMTDMPTNVLTLMREIEDDETEVKSVAVYAPLIRPDGALNMIEEDDEYIEQPPAEFERLLTEITSFEHEDVEPWQPDVLELMLWDPDFTRSATRWDDELPDLESNCAVERRDDFYSLYLPPDTIDYLRETRQSGNGTALRINGQNWAYDVRYPFPHETYMIPKA